MQKVSCDSQRPAKTVEVRANPQAAARRYHAALAKSEAPALRVLAERLEHGEARLVDISINLAAA